MSLKTLLISLCIAFALVNPSKIIAQKLETFVSADSVAVGDSFSVKYIFNGNLDSITKISLTETQNFNSISNNSSESRSTTLEDDGTYRQQHSLTKTISLSALKLGSFQIPICVIELRDGKLIRSLPISITVLNEGTFGKNKNFDDLLAKEDSLVRSFASRDFGYAPAIKLMKSVKTNYVLITGISYHFYGASPNPRMIMEEIQTYLRGLSSGKVIESYTGNLPRVYFELNDTVGIRKGLENIYHKYGDSIRTQTIISKPKEWSYNDEIENFSSEHDFWEVLYASIDNSRDQFLDNNSQRKLVVEFDFKTKDELNSFVNAATALGFAQEEIQDISNTPRGGYILSLSKNIECNKKLFIQELHAIRALGLNPRYNGLFTSYYLYSG